MPEHLFDHQKLGVDRLALEYVAVVRDRQRAINSAKGNRERSLKDRSRRFRMCLAFPAGSMPSWSFRRRSPWKIRPECFRRACPGGAPTDRLGSVSLSPIPRFAFGESMWGLGGLSTLADQLCFRPGKARRKTHHRPSVPGQTTRAAHLLGIDVAGRKVSASQKRGQFLGVDSIALGFSTVNRHGKSNLKRIVSITGGRS